MELYAELRSFFEYFEVDEEKARSFCSELNSDEMITSKHQLFLLDNKSWKNMRVSSLVLRDGLEAWVNDELKPEEKDNDEIDMILTSAVKKLELNDNQQNIILSKILDTGIKKYKHLKVLRKKTLYKLGLPVILVQELRNEIKATRKSSQSSTSLPFCLPIVSASGRQANREKDAEKNMADLSLGLTNFATVGDRVVREVDGIKYEYDRKCPHKQADLTFAEIENGILICPKHKWKFDLNNGGRCITKSCSINALQLDW